jgi:cell division protein ZapA
MAEVTITINGRAYEIACDNGQEGRVVDIAAFIDQRMQQIARGGAAYNDAHLMVLTTLTLADELFELRETAPIQETKKPAVANKEEEQAILRVLEQMTKRIEGIATRVQAV